MAPCRKGSKASWQPLVHPDHGGCAGGYLMESDNPRMASCSIMDPIKRETGAGNNSIGVSRITDSQYLTVTIALVFVTDGKEGNLL